MRQLHTLPGIATREKPSQPGPVSKLGASAETFSFKNNTITQPDSLLNSFGSNGFGGMAAVLQRFVMRCLCSRYSTPTGYIRIYA